VNLGGHDDTFNLANTTATTVVAQGGTGADTLNDDPATLNFTLPARYLNFIV